MHPITRSVLIAALALTAVIPARAAHGPGCEDEWRGTNATRTCGFALRGVPVMLSGTAATRAGMASVTVTVSVLLPDGEHELARCTDSGALQASCSTEWSPLQDPVDPIVTTVPLICRVRGTSTHPDTQGTYGCFSWQA